MDKGIPRKSYKYISVIESQAKAGGKPIFGVINNKSADVIGYLEYYSRWRQYVFTSEPGCVFNNSCLRDIVGFLENVAPGASNG